MATPRADRVNGVLLLDKPSGISSNRALQVARRLFNAAKAGHTGTLDPMASGLLPLTFGEATKFSADLLDADKSYRATLRLGITTTTGDADGDVIRTQPVEIADGAVADVLSQLTGAIEQVPPMYSALKREGKPLYVLARAGVEVERRPREVEIRRLQQISFDGEQLTIEVDCSKGTYVRVLAEQIGQRLGCGAHLVALRRTRVGPLNLTDAVTLQQLQQLSADERSRHLLPVDRLLSTLPAVALDAALTQRFRLGQRLPVDATPRCARVKVYGAENELLGTATVNEWGVVGPERLISSELDS